MKIRHFLPGLAILICLSSCSKEFFLLPANSGGYNNAGRSEKEGTPASERNFDESREEVILTATSEDSGLAITDKVASFPERNSSDGKMSGITNYDGVAQKPARQEPANQTKFALGYLKKSLHKKNTDALAKPATDEDSDNTFSILSFSFGLGGLLLALLFGSGIAYLLGLPAIIFGIIALSRKEELKALAIAGLIMGIIEIVVLIGVIIFFLSY